MRDTSQAIRNVYECIKTMFIFSAHWRECESVGYRKYATAILDSCLPWMCWLWIRLWVPVW